MASAAELEAWWARARDTLARMNRVLADGGEERYTAAHAFPPPLAPPPAAAAPTRDAGLGPPLAERLTPQQKRTLAAATQISRQKAHEAQRAVAAARAKRKAPDAAASGMVTLVAPRPPRDAAPAGTTATAAAAAAAAAVRRRGAAAPTAR